MNDRVDKMLRIVLILLGTLICASSSDFERVFDLSEFELDAQRHLKHSWLVSRGNSQGCGDYIFEASLDTGSKNRRYAELWGKASVAIFDRFDNKDAITGQELHRTDKDSKDSRDSKRCFAAFLERGTPEEYLADVFHSYIYQRESDSNNNNENEKEKIKAFMKLGGFVEMGFQSFHTSDIDLLWVQSQEDQSRHERAALGYTNGRVLVQVGVIQPGEINTLWREAVMGHTFVLRDTASTEVLMEFTAEYNSFNVIGEGKDPGPAPLEQDVREDVYRILVESVGESRKVLRRFTEVGFTKGRLPRHLYSCILSFYYNNRNSRAYEAWGVHDRHVNWWQAPAYMIVAPWKLKGLWQEELRGLVEGWLGGVALETTDLYGLREYTDGARLLSHVDRQSTHAASLIINVEQIDMREPWPVEIYDHEGRLHEITMEPGDIIYYESARCIHGRMRPLRGASYINLFSHYRPSGDPEWYSYPKAPSPPSIGEIGRCEVTDEGSVSCDGPTTKGQVQDQGKGTGAGTGTGTGAGAGLEFLSPSLARLGLHSEDPSDPGGDLFDWWDWSALGEHFTAFPGRRHGQGQGQGEL
jgi:hypothetical protein